MWDDDAILGALGFDLLRVALYVHRIGNGPELHRDVDADGGVGVDLYSGLRVITVSWLAGVEIVDIHLERGEIVKSFGVGDDFALHIGGDPGYDDRHAWHYSAAGVSDHSGDRTGNGCPSHKRSQQDARGYADKRH